MLLIGLFYIFIPLLFIGILFFKRQPNIILWLSSVLTFGSVIAYMWASARWEIPGIYFRPVFPVLFIIASVLSYRRIRKPAIPPRKWVTILIVGINAAVLIFISGLNWFIFKGYSKPDGVIELSSPLRGNKYIVLHGGSSPFSNAHYHVRPQNFALDIVGLNKLGMRAGSIAGGSDLDDYVIFGEPVYSPCEGTVVRVVDEYEDLIPPNRDTEHLAGNFVLIENSNGIEILLAHLKRGSILVKKGDRVTTGSLLGQVGNTGNTSEPHLHIHAEKGGEPGVILDGKGVPFTIDNRYLVRGSIIK